MSFITRLKSLKEKLWGHFAILQEEGYSGERLVEFLTSLTAHLDRVASGKHPERRSDDRFLSYIELRHHLAFMDLPDGEKSIPVTVNLPLHMIRDLLVVAHFHKQGFDHVFSWVLAAGMQHGDVRGAFRSE